MENKPVLTEADKAKAKRERMKALEAKADMEVSDILETQEQADEAGQKKKFRKLYAFLRKATVALDAKYRLKKDINDILEESREMLDSAYKIID